MSLFRGIADRKETKPLYSSLRLRFLLRDASAIAVEEERAAVAESRPESYEHVFEHDEALVHQLPTSGFTEERVESITEPVTV